MFNVPGNIQYQVRLIDQMTHRFTIICKMPECMYQLPYQDSGNGRADAEKAFQEHIKASHV